MSSSTRTLNGVSIDVGSLFHMSVDFNHLQLTILTILDALNKSQDRTDQLEKSMTDQTKAMTALQTRCDAQSQKLLEATAAFDAQAVEMADLKKKDAASQARLTKLEAEMKELQELHLGPTLKDHSSKLNAVGPRLTALDEEDAALRAQLAAQAKKLADMEKALAEAQALASAAASAAAQAANSNANSKRASNEKVVAFTPPQPHPSTNSQNHDLIMAKLKQIESKLEDITGRVILLEQRPIGSTAAAAPATAFVPSSTGNSNDAQLQRQLAATAAELKQIHAQLAALEKAMQDKASLAQLEDKTDKKDMNALVEKVLNHTRSIKELERDLQHLRDQIAALQNSNAVLLAKMNALLDASSCGECHAAVPTVKCGKCAKSFCDACDEKVHGANASAEMRAHLRTPLQPISTVTFATPDPVFTAPVKTSSLSEVEELRRWTEDQFNAVARKEKTTRGDIHELYSRDKELRQKLADLLKANKEDKNTFDEIMAAIKKLETELRNLITNTGTTSRNYTDNRVEELLLKLRELERALEKGMKSELKRFERDVLVFMESQAEGGHGHSDASVGKIHFRCLSCDQHVNNLQGPSSLLYARAVGQGLPINPNATNMNIDRGKELFLNGRDGGVYKGREPSVVTIANGDPNRNAQFNVHYADRMITTNQRGTTIVDQKTVNMNYDQPGGGSRSYTSTPQRQLSRPMSAPYDEPMKLNRPPDSLPPTRPSTRGGQRQPLTARAGSATAHEEKTPVREQLTANF